MSHVLTREQVTARFLQLKAETIHWAWDYTVELEAHEVALHHQLTQMTQERDGETLRANGNYIAWQIEISWREKQLAQSMNIQETLADNVNTGLLEIRQRDEEIGRLKELIQKSMRETKLAGIEDILRVAMTEGQHGSGDYQLACRVIAEECRERIAKAQP